MKSICVMVLRILNRTSSASDGILPFQLYWLGAYLYKCTMWQSLLVPPTSSHSFRLLNSLLNYLLSWGHRSWRFRSRLLIACVWRWPISCDCLAKFSVFVGMVVSQMAKKIAGVSTLCCHRLLADSTHSRFFENCSAIITSSQPKVCPYWWNCVFFWYNCYWGLDSSHYAYRDYFASMWFSNTVYSHHVAIIIVIQYSSVPLFLIPCDDKAFIL